MRFVILAMILTGCTSSQSSSLTNPPPDMAMDSVQDMDAPVDAKPAADLTPDSTDAANLPDMLVAAPDMTQDNTPDMLVVADMTPTPDLTPAVDMTPPPDLTPPGPDMTGLYCHSNATNAPGDTATWCSTFAISGSNSSQAQDACQQYNGPARAPATVCYACAFYSGATLQYYAYSSQVFTGGKCATGVPMWIYGLGSSNLPLTPGDIGYPSSSATQYGRWAP